MRKWFKYQYGYLNIDDSNICFTNSGNWSETIHLEERKAGQEGLSKRWKRFRIVAFLTVFNIVLAWFTLLQFRGLFSLLSIAGSVVLSIRVFNYLSPELGSSFRIPIPKVIDVRENGNNIHLLFYDREGVEAEVHINGLEVEGIKHLKSLHNQTNINN